MPEITGEAWIDIVLVVVVIVAAILGGMYAYRATGKHNRQYLKSLAEKGYVIHHAHEKNRGSVTRIWAPFSEAVPFYVHISNRDLLQVVAGPFAIKDIKIGNGEFDRAFVVRSNRPDQVKRFLTPNIQTRLLKMGDIAFMSGSNESLVCADFPSTNREERKLRQYWMVVTHGELSEEEAQPYFEFGRELAKRVEALCKDQPASSVSELTSVPFEGR